MSEPRQTALVTGAGQGIGLGIATHLAQAGFNVAVGDVQDSDTVSEAMEGLRALGTEVLYCRMDVSSAENRATTLQAVRERFGGLNVLVNNAGVAPRVRADILEAGEESFDRLMSINLKGPYFLTQAAANMMIEQRREDPEFKACIINISSISATTASPSRGEYCISKAGVSMATKLWAVRLGEFDIPVYEIRPGIILTDMTEPVREKYDKLIAEGLLVQPRWGKPDDIGRAAAMLAAGSLAYSTGQVIMVDGGFSLERL